MISEQWLRDCVDARPEYRPTFDQLLALIQQARQQLARTSVAAQPAYVSSTERVYSELMQHFGGDAAYRDICAPMTTDIDSLKRPWSQHLMDAFHESGEEWQDFVAHTKLSELQGTNVQMYSQLLSFQYNFSRALYSPLSPFLQAHRGLFQGNADELLRNIVDVYNHLKTRYVAPNCCLHVDVTLKQLLALSESQESGQDCRDEDDEGDEDPYQVKQQRSKPEVRHLSQDYSEQEHHGTVYDLDSQDMNMEQVLRDVIPDLSREAFSYKRYTLTMEGVRVQGAETATYNTVPKCAIENGPLCMLYNTVQSKTSSGDDFTFSFQVFNDRINVYLLVNDEAGTVYGSPVRKHDLFETVPLLFADGMTDDSLANDVHFKHDAGYETFLWDLYPPSIRTTLQNLSGYVTFWNAHSAYPLDLEQMTRCFVRNRIDERKFAASTKDSRSTFSQLLRTECGVKAGPALSLWRYFASGCDQKVRDEAVIRQYARQVRVKDERIRELEAQVARLSLPH